MIDIPFSSGEELAIQSTDQILMIDNELLDSMVARRCSKSAKNLYLPEMVINYSSFLPCSV